ncbi:uncharacterized protein YdcH (DUF465 family) [Pseudomonas sp. JUb42]|jgi:uncharacterized protein YdcH (DUF465 family)|uniref:DUF465 domain-containing protein n=1 Tax=Pseudomonas sp. JUb42 TaxID=2940611 RepID=UPI002169A7A9|nr:DUF465 domain-containing protein [Pseudomonas sp. JUb42]MCS3470251.1 uncharacterized protein YdcH (DUF465 family) [Pseudomonas sp. JUb42]
MPVKHDLFKDLGFTREQVAERSKADKKLNQLLVDYDEIDAGVLKAEAGAAGSVSDEQLNRLKEKRLRIKDGIMQHMQQT